MAIFLGEFDHLIDRKYRISVPAPFRKRLAKDGIDELVIRPGVDPCLHLGTEAHIEAITQRVGHERRGWDELSRTYQTWAGSLSSQSSLDEQGRVQLTKKQMEYAGLGARAIIVGCFDHIEVWNEQRYREHLEKVATRNLDYRALAEHVLRDEPPPPREERS